MTDTYVEKLIIEKFLEIESLEATPKCISYFQLHKEDDEPLESFIVFMPNYPEELKSENEPYVSEEPEKPKLPDFTKDNPDTEFPWTPEEIAAEKEKFENDYKKYQEDYRTYLDEVVIHKNWIEERKKIEDPLLSFLIRWFRDDYPAVYKTHESNIDDDELYEAIKSVDVDLTSIQRIIKMYDEDGNKKEVPIYPNVAFPNADFTRPVDKDGNNTFWYELYFIPAPPSQHELGTKGRSRWIGIMQINICIPKTWGTDELNARYDEIATLFRSGLILQGVRITRTYRTSALNDDDFYYLPVTVEWQADLDR